MKDHERRELVNELRSVALEFNASQQLRERISRCLAPVDSLREEIAKLREELASLKASVFEYEADELGVYSVFQILSETRKRAEAAEAKLKAASEQEPVAYCRENRDGLYDFDDRYASDRPIKLYAAPIPPADVQELKQTIADQLRTIKTLNECLYGEGSTTTENVTRIAALERKLAEQQAAIRLKNEALLRWTIGTCVCHTKTDTAKFHALNCPYRVAREAFDVESNSEELNTLLAQAREEGRLSAVPEGLEGFSMPLCREEWGCVIDGLLLERERSEKRKAVNSESTSNERAEMCIKLIDRINKHSAEAMLASAPKPEGAA